MGARRPPRRARPRSPGTTTTARSTGRATAARCCASRPSSPPTGRPRASTSSTASAGRSRRVRHARGDRPRAPGRPGRPRALHAAHQGQRAQPAHAHVRDRRHPVDAPDMPNRAAIPNGPPGIWVSSRTLRRGDTYTVDVYTPKPTERELRAAGAYYDRDFDDYRTIELARPQPAPNSGAPPGPVPVEVHFPEWDLRAASRPTSSGRGVGDASDRARSTAEQVLARSDLRADVGALAAPRATAPTTRSTTSSRSRPTSAARLHLHRGAAGQGAHARGLPVRRQVRLLPAVLGRDGAAAADGRHPRARGHRLHLGLLRPQGEGVRRARPRRPLLGRGVVPRLRLGHVRPDAVGRAAALAERRPRRGAGHRRRARPRRRRRARPARRHGRQPRARRGSSTSAAACSPLLLLGRRRRRLPAPRPPPGPAARARARAAAHAPRAEPGRDAAGARGVVRPLARRRGLRARAARPALRRPRRRADERPARAACAASWGAAAGCADGCAHGGRCRRGAVPAAARTIDAHG